MRQRHLRFHRVAPLFSLSYVGVSAKLFYQLSSRCRYRNFAVKNFMAVYLIAVHGFVSTFVGLHYGAVQAHSRKNALGPRVRQNLRVQFKVSPSSGIFSPEASLHAPGTGLLPGTDDGPSTDQNSGVEVGDLVGRVGVNEVRTPFAGEVVRWLAVDAERVQEGQPLVWLRVPEQG